MACPDEVLGRNWNPDLTSSEELVLNERLRRVTDLFIEGTELYFGNDENDQPILMWVSKLNSFEVEEARRDAATKRGMRIAELTKDDCPELIVMKAAIATWSDDQLAEHRVEQQSDDIYLEVYNDVEADSEWREKLEIVRRGTQLLDDEGAPPDDKRRDDVMAVQTEYLTKVRDGQAKLQLERLREIKENSRTTNIEEFLEAWRNRVSLDVFMQERRVTELYMGLRDCKGTIKSRDEGNLLFDHADCDHSKRLLNARSEVYELPERVIERAIDALDGITVPIRESGNSDAPASSSASSEQSSAEAEVSTPSIPVETPPDAPTT